MELPNDLINWAATAGPATIFALLWWLERTERREMAKENRELAERVTTGLNTTTAAVQMLKELLQSGSRHE